MNSAPKIYQILLKTYPSAATELNFRNIYQLFVSVLLSAQCTDKRVNKTTPDFFRVYPDFPSLSNADINEIMKIIKPCGLFRSKSKNLISSAKQIINKFSGIIPSNGKDLQSLPGIGRKSANVLLGVGFQIPAFPVDTHVGRLSRRLGWSAELNPLKVEKDVTALFPKENWIKLHHCLILHGRYICKARKPLCRQCIINKYCPSVQNPIKK